MKRGALADIGREDRELETALTRRDAALEAWSEAYQATATTLEGLYRSAGHAAHGRRIRPTNRRARGEVVAQDDETAEGSPELVDVDALVDDPAPTA